MVTTERLRLGEGVLLAVLSAFSIRIYEAMIYVGPLLVAMTLWRVRLRARGAPARELVAVFLYLLAAAFFAAGTWVAYDSIVRPFNALSALHLDDTLQQARSEERRV